jgi:TolB-like protein
MINRKRLASILEVKEFLTVIIRQSGEAISVEAALHNLEKKEPLWAKVFEWSQPWTMW